MPEAITAASLTRQYAKLCDLPDFGDPEIAALIPEIAPDHSAAEPHRKAWEFAMGALFLRDTGHLDGDAEILDLGAGHEEIVFWLAQRAKRVLATDIYGRGAFGDREATASMLEDPASLAPYPYPEDRLDVRDMDARRLDLEDESVDAVVSFSSIEHFGGPSGIEASAREIGRVLRPGGHAFLVTELFVEQHPIDHRPIQFAVRLATLGRRCAGATPRWGPTEVFNERQLRNWVLKPSGLELMQPFDLSLSEASKSNVHWIEQDGSVASSTGKPYPHILLRAHLSTFTSLCLPLVKL